MSPKEQAYKNMAEGIIKKFSLRGIEGYYCNTKAEALEMSKSFLNPGCSVSFGGSETLKQIGLIPYLKESDYILYDRGAASTEEEKKLIYSKIVTSDYFFMSSNAISLDGELINIDGFGNRVACLITGPENVIIVAGMNKIVTNVENGIERTRNISAPPNSLRLGLSTPCSEKGRCCNCLADDCICCEIVITRKSKIPGRIKAILVGEELGY